MSTGGGPSGPRRDQEPEDEQSFADVLNAFSFGDTRRRRKKSGTRGTPQEAARQEGEQASPQHATEPPGQEPSAADQPPYGVPSYDGQPAYGGSPADNQSAYGGSPADNQSAYGGSPAAARPPAPAGDDQSAYGAQAEDPPPYAGQAMDRRPRYAAAEGRPGTRQPGNVAGQPGDVAGQPGDGEREAPAAAVRAYVWTGGRTRSHYNFEVETLVTAAEQAGAATDVTQPEQAVLELCREPMSVAEVAALLAMPLGVTKVLLGDMADRGLIVVHGTTNGADNALGPGLMERVLTGLRRL